MSVDSTIEGRLAAVEQAVRELQQTVEAKRKVDPNWLARLTGSMADEPAFLEVIEYGKAFRHADRPPEGPGS